MAEKLDFRALRADEVQVRFLELNNKQNPTGVRFLLYKDARCDMRILDERFGAFGWSREHKMLDGKLYCSVSIYNEETKSWVTKDDAGEETQIAEAKGEASDAFKRACFNWGIGRELYTVPKKIEIPFDSDFERQKQNIFGLYVSEMVVNDHRIDKLVISDKLKPRFTWTRQGGAVVPQPTTQQVQPKPRNTPANPTAMTKEEFKARWGVNNAGGITNEECADCAKAWGLCDKPKTMPIDKVVGMVLDAAGVPLSAPSKPKKSEAIAYVKAELPKCQNGDDLMKLWAVYPLYQHDAEFAGLFTERKKQLGIK